MKSCFVQLATPLRPKAKGSRGGLLGLGRARSEELELQQAAALTDEEVFQPEIQRALLLGSIVKEFHEVVLARTARVLEMGAASEAAFSVG